MKPVLFAVVVLLFANTAFAQNNTTYCDLKVYKQEFTSYVYFAALNYSEAPRKKFTVITGKDGKKEKFSSEMDALNYMLKQGWYLVTAYHSHEGETHFFLKKE
jgi:hypothetical protein